MSSRVGMPSAPPPVPPQPARAQIANTINKPAETALSIRNSCSRHDAKISSEVILTPQQNASLSTNWASAIGFQPELQTSTYSWKQSAWHGRTLDFHSVR